MHFSHPKWYTGTIKFWGSLNCSVQYGDRSDDEQPIELRLSESTSVHIRHNYGQLRGRTPRMFHRTDCDKNPFEACHCDSDCLQWWMILRIICNLSVRWDSRVLLELHTHKYGQHNYLPVENHIKTFGILRWLCWLQGDEADTGTKGVGSSQDIYQLLPQKMPWHSNVISGVMCLILSTDYWVLYPLTPHSSSCRSQHSPPTVAQKPDMSIWDVRVAGGNVAATRLTLAGTAGYNWKCSLTMLEWTGEKLFICFSLISN